MDTTTTSNPRTYFSHFHPSAIYQTLTDAATKIRTQYNLPSINPLHYLDPRTQRDYIVNSLSEGGSDYDYKSVLKILVRVVVSVCVFLLLRGKVQGFVRGISGAPERREEGLVGRVKEKERERDAAANTNGKKQDEGPRRTTTTGRHGGGELEGEEGRRKNKGGGK